MGPQILHYHIRWSLIEPLDWECFGTRNDAEKKAAEWVRQDETYTIEEHGDGCPRCRDSAKAKFPPIRGAQT